ncbi:CHAT domain-containing protein [Mycena maculata]|uniref:CHAT domain-containing protein n=1 Tax=Mycena maculata TaxID=230809 RepID=A0AAD7HQG2_9AGAR|nr:CHAT domain-containing protein [Mycena maculata]
MCTEADTVTQGLQNTGNNEGDTLDDPSPGNGLLSREFVADLELTTKMEIGKIFVQAYRNGGDLNDLEVATLIFKEVVELTPVDHPNRPEWLQYLAACLTSRYRRLGDMEAALQTDQEAVNLTPADDPHRAGRLENLAGSFTARYRRFGDLKDLDAALQSHGEAVDLTPVNHPNRASQLQGFASSLADRYQRLGDLKDLEAALKGHQESVDLTPADHPDRARRLQSLTRSLTDRYRRFGALKDLEAALQWDQEAVDLTPEDHPERGGRLHNLAVSLTDQYQRLGDPKVLEAALQRHQEAVHLTPEDHPNRAIRLQGRAESLTDQYRRLGDLEDLEAAAQKFEEVVGLTPVDHPDRPGRVQSLAMCLTDRYHRLGNLEDLEAALQGDQEAVYLTPADHPDRVVDLTPGDHPNRAKRLQNLAVSFKDRYQTLGDLKDLEAALQRNQEAVDLTPVDHPDLAGQVQDLAVSFSDRYKRLGNVKDLKAALQRHQKAVHLTPVDHPDRVKRLQMLAVSLTDQYQRLGDLKDLESALQTEQEVVDLTPQDHPDRSRRLKGLAVSFTHRYRKLGDLKDLDAALQAHQEAVDLTPTDHPTRAEYLQGLASSLADRYQRLGDLKDLEAALQGHQEAVDLTPENHPDRAERLQSLSASFSDRYRRLGDLKDLEHALQRDQEALHLTPVDHPGRATRLQNLAASFKDWYQILGDLKDLEAALQRNKEAVALTPRSPPDHPNWADRSILKNQEIFNSSTLTIVIPSKPRYFLILNCLGVLLYDGLHSPKNFSLHTVLLPIQLPDLLWLGHTIHVRQDAIRRLDIGKTGSAATRACVKVADLISAVQLLEQGLATTFQQILQLKSDLDILPPEQAELLKRLSYELYGGKPDSPSKVARERQELLQAIHKQPGLEHFLLPRPYTVLCHASQGGPVVILNSHEDACDGIIILNPTTEPVHVALPNVTLDVLQSQHTALKELLSRCDVRSRRESASTRLFGYPEGFALGTIEGNFTDLLTWLWNNVVEPVYQVLASHEIHNGRLWWLPSATLGSLLEAQAKKASKTQHRVGVVGVTHTGLHGANHLKGVKEEVEKICSIVKDPNRECLVGEEATPTAVTDLLQHCSWVHLACHGVQDLIEPTKSRLILYDGVLELETILRMPLSNAEFVFLAACQTAMGDAELVNESFHLGGGFIAAGFCGAIGTLWSMNDQDGPVVAEHVYSHLFRDGRQPHASDAAEALQLAVNKLKAQKVPYQRWIPFIHMGI